MRLTEFGRAELVLRVQGRAPAEKTHFIFIILFYYYTLPEINLDDAAGIGSRYYFGVWLSLVERAVWVREAQGSNPCTPISRQKRI